MIVAGRALKKCLLMIKKTMEKRQMSETTIFVRVL